MGTVLQSLIVSASLGALIGLIRQWAEQQDADKTDLHFAGLRTFVLWSVLGYTAAYLSSLQHTPVFIATLALVGAHILLKGFGARKYSAIGLTTSAAAFITLFIGALVYWDRLLFAVMLAALTMIVLGIKQFSHAWTRRFTPEDIRSTLQFAAVSGVILPLVPNHGYGPYQALNPYSLWWMVVLISGLGFVGYILMRWLGTQAGVALTGLIGGLASSTATTLAFSRESKTYPLLYRSFALAIVMASTIMLARVLIILVFIFPQFLSVLWLPFAIMALPGVAYTLILHFFFIGKHVEMDLPHLKNPLDLAIAIKFGCIYGVISVLVKIFTHTDLTSGLLALSFVSGLTDMDAIALSITNNLKDGSIGMNIATRAVIIAALANTILKGTLVLVLGSHKLKKQIFIAFSATLLAGVFAYYLV